MGDEPRPVPPPTANGAPVTALVPRDTVILHTESGVYLYTISATDFMLYLWQLCEDDDEIYTEVKDLLKKNYLKEFRNGP